MARPLARSPSAKKAHFQQLCGEELIGSYKQSEHITRYFCAPYSDAVGQAH